MTEEDQKRRSMGRAWSDDPFPVGMRVLAVDDNPICLKFLENLLRKCQYQVTASNSAIQALKMLRENRDKFDLVISDVNMPDMDGFKLLELVGLEMDLPVIMLSAHSDTKLVMKGITHGAVDYLLKPVRVEELKNVWQHVIRRKKFDPKDANKSSDQDKAVCGISESESGFSLASNADSAKVSRKRKDTDEDEEEEGEENGHENDDPSNQKKPRVVWSVELHRKFVSAVNQLGLEKAVPKKILDLMNVEGITRENVASHLQKYRLYLKRIRIVATQQANMVAALGSKDTSYMRIGSLDGFGFTGSRTLSNTTLSSYPPSTMIGRLNSPSGSSLHGITSSGMFRHNTPQNPSNSINTLGKFPSSVLPTNQTTSLLELNQLQQGQSTIPFRDLNAIQNSSGFTVPSSSNSISCASSNPLILGGSTKPIHSMRTFGNLPSNLLDHDPCNENWHGSVQLSRFASNGLGLSETYFHNQLPSNTSNVPVDFASTNGILNPLKDFRGDIQCQEDLIGNVVQATNCTRNQSWEEQIQDHNQNPSPTFSGMNSLGYTNSVLDQNNVDLIKDIDVPLIGELIGGAPSLLQQTLATKSAVDMSFNSSGSKFLDQTKSQDVIPQSNYDPLEDIMNAMIKRGENELVLMDGEFGFDAYSLGSCI